ncbi:MAG: replicative DNA helicase [bacterium]|nr:replicative DNA helicase [bacterium]
MDEALIKRVPPHSIEAEQSVVGAMLIDKDAITTASEIICGDDFYQTAYGVVFDSVVELFNEGKPVDLVTLQNRLKEKEVPEEISSLEFVRDLVAAVPTSANVKYYAEIVAEKATLRKMIRLNEEIANACYLAKEPVEAIMERTEKKVFELVQNRNTGDYVPIKQVVLNALERIEKASKSKGTVTGIPTGFIDLDYKTSGLQPSDFILVAARPSMGKTAFVLNIAQHVAFRQNKTVAIFSLEMSKEQLVNRLFSLESYVDAQLLRTGNLKDSDWEKLIEGAGTIGKSNLIIDDTPGISISEMRSKCRKYKLEHGLDLIIIDYLQLMSGSVGKRSDSRQQEISDISRSLKALARELNVPVISLSQLSRAVEQRPDHRPMLSDLRESGAIEQDADVVMFIYRDDYYHKDTEHVNEAEIIIAKQRNGPIGTVTLTWLPQYTKFANSQKQIPDYE